MANTIEINVYDSDNNLRKKSIAVPSNIKFGTVRAIMKLFKDSDFDDVGQFTMALYGVWDEVTAVLEQFFPDMTDEDWDDANFSDVGRALYDIAKYTLVQMVRIPHDEGN